MNDLDDILLLCVCECPIYIDIWKTMFHQFTMLDH